MQVGEGDLRGGEEPVVLFGVVKNVLAELREPTARPKILFAQHRWGIDLEVSVCYVLVEHPGDQAASEASAGSLQHDEAASRKLGPALEVDDVQRFTYLPVGLWLKIEFLRLPGLADHDVSAFVWSVGNVIGGDVRYFEQKFAQPRLQLPDLCLQGLQSLTQERRPRDQVRPPVPRMFRFLGLGGLCQQR